MRRVTLIVMVLLVSAAGAAHAADRGCGFNDRRGLTRADPRDFLLELVGLTADQRLICFGEAWPHEADNNGPVTGLTGDARLVGIDFRPATGELWGLGDGGGLYVVDARTGVASLRARLNMPLSGSSFGVDFNPTVDRLRIVSDTGQNLRVNVDTGAVTLDTALSPAPGTGVTAAAYTNNDADADTGTTLYVIDTSADQLLIQAPPNAGMLNATGRLKVDAGVAAGFDIYTRVRGGTSDESNGFAAFTEQGRTRLYRIDLFSGRAVFRGQFRAVDTVIGLAIPTAQQ